MIERYDRRLRRTARRYSLCADDADDAYQRALEILLKKAPDVGPERLVRWMHTVTRHEAYAVRRQREKLLGGNRVESVDGSETDVIDLIPSDAPEPDVGAERSERVARGFEALRALKPQEIRTLTLKAEGYSYEEIGEITGFSRTKINRCMVEGRRRFLEKFSAIEAGKRCDELSPAVSALADGELRDGEDPGLMQHLSSCAHCRAKLREYRRVPKRVLSLAPVAVLGGPPMTARVADRVLAAGERTKELMASVLHRGGAVDASQTLASGGGARGSGLAVLGVVCGLGAAGGGAAVCVDQGLLPNPVDGADKPARVVAAPVPVPTVPAEIPVVAAPADAPAPAPAQELRAPAEQITPTQQRERDFGFEQQQQRAVPSQVPSSDFGGEVVSGGGSGGGGSSGGGGTGSAGGFGIEK